MKIGLLGKKIGMTRVYDDKGKATPVTVIEAGGNTLLQTKTTENDGYASVQVGFDTQKEQRVTQPLLGHFKKAGSEPKKRIKEFRLPDGTTLEGAIDLSVSQFAVGDVVDVIGRSKGKGFQGVVRKHNMAGQGQSHGSMMHRRNGAIGNRSTPGRIWKNMGMPGHMGDERVTVQNLKVVQVRPEEGVILISGAVPGANGTYIVIRPAKKVQPEAAK
ncbi:MAG: 50S ribosomal protein L3 [Chthoniobacter sp.]|uniref:50S ribosomal protein L3 n=1 Tax=Chthoniobacter sp. TaxID=2510640 RepID=UPI0032A608D5